jgi:hypothetical protein
MCIRSSIHVYGQLQTAIATDFSRVQDETPSGQRVLHTARKLIVKHNYAVLRPLSSELFQQMTSHSNVTFTPIEKAAILDLEDIARLTLDEAMQKELWGRTETLNTINRHEAVSCYVASSRRLIRARVTKPRE